MAEDKKTEETDLDISNFEREINKFLKHINSLWEVVPYMLELVAAKLIHDQKSLADFVSSVDVRKKVRNKKTDDDELLIPAESIHEFIELSDAHEASEISYVFLPISFTVSFVSQFDAYIGDLIRAIFVAKPQILNSSYLKASTMKVQ